MPSSAYDVVVIGGGVAGLSTAFQLAKRGTKVCVLEREKIGNGSTGRAAGFLGQLRGKAEHTRMLMRSIDLLRELEQQTGLEIFVQTGSLRLAATEERVHEIQSLFDMARSIGLHLELVDRQEIDRLLPYMVADDILSGCHCPTDGHVRPAQLVEAYLNVGKAHGVAYLPHHPVTNLERQGEQWKIITSDEEFLAGAVVNAAGPWSYGVADLAHTTLPTAAVGHFYLTTQSDPSHPIDRLSPAIRDRENRIYARPEQGGLIVGLYGAQPVEYDTDDLPIDFDMSAMKLAAHDPNVEELLAAAKARFPWIDKNTPMEITSGIMTFTPDGHPFCGQMPETPSFYHCAGFCGHGIVQSPAIGQIMCELILDGKSSFDIDAIHADRFFDAPGFQARADIKRRCADTYANYYGAVEKADAVRT